jgi:hypothetical protein
MNQERRHKNLVGWGLRVGCVFHMHIVCVHRIAHASVIQCMSMHRLCPAAAFSTALCYLPLLHLHPQVEQLLDRVDAGREHCWHYMHCLCPPATCNI